MLFVFAPLEIYFSNIDEFWFGLTNLLPIIGITFFVIFGLLIFLLGIIYRKGGLYSKLYCLFLGLFIGLYIQGNYIPRDYGVLDGQQIQWDQYDGYGTASIILWSVIVLAVIFMCIKFSEQIYKTGYILCVCILLIQIVTIGILGIQNSKTNIPVVVTEKEEFNLSSNKNIVVLLLDAYDSYIMRELLEEDYDKYASILNDFTYYPDTSGGYPTTKGSLPFILTGKWYENDVTYQEYVDEGYQETELYDLLLENNYRVDVYTSLTYLGTDTTIFDNVLEGRYSVKNHIDFAKTLYKLVGFNYMPHQIKKEFVIYSGDFEKYKGVVGNKYQPYSENVIKFYEKLQKQGLQTSNDAENSFKFYHLEGAHAPYTFGEDLSENEDEEFTIFDEGKGCLIILNEYLQQLKKLGVYNDTAVIIMADHGQDSDLATTSMNVNPLFMIKGFHETHSFQVSDVAFTYADFQLLLNELVKNNQTIPSSYLEQIEKSERRFLHYSWDSSWDKEYLPKLDEYKIVGMVYEDSSRIPTGRLYLSKDDEELIQGYLFKGNAQIPIQADKEDFQNLVFNGLGDIELTPDGNTYVWTTNNYAYFVVRFDPSFDKNFKFVLSIGGTVGGTRQSVIAFANGEKINDVLVGENEIDVNVSNEYIANSMLHLVLYFPDSYVPAVVDEGTDERRLAYLITGISCEEYNRLAR